MTLTQSRLATMVLLLAIGSLPVVAQTQHIYSQAELDQVLGPTGGGQLCDGGSGGAIAWEPRLWAGVLRLQPRQHGLPRGRVPAQIMNILNC